MINEEVLNLEVVSGEKLSNLFNNNEGIVLFSVPILKDVTSEIELNNLQEIYLNFRKLNWDVVISTVETEENVREYVSENNFKVPILADTDLIVSKFFRIIGESGNPLRRTFVIDNKHQIKRMFKQIMPIKHPREVLKWIELNDQRSVNLIEKGLSAD